MTERQARYLFTALLIIPLLATFDVLLRPPEPDDSIREAIYLLLFIPFVILADCAWYNPQVIQAMFGPFRPERERTVTASTVAPAKENSNLGLTAKTEKENQAPPAPAPQAQPANRNLAWWIGAALLAGAAIITPIALCALAMGAMANLSPLPRYTLINKELGSNTKCILDIRLEDRIEEGQIRALAEHLRTAEGANCSPLFIFYFLPGDVPGTDIAWAYSHYNPDLQVNINALDLPTKATLEAAPIGEAEDVVGVWLDTGAVPHKIIIRKINSSYQMTTLFDDGSGSTKTLTVKVVDGEERLYEDIDNSFGDYMVIKKNGYLAYYDNAGFIKEFPPQ